MFYYLTCSSAKKWFWGQELTKIDTEMLARKGMRGFDGSVCIRIVGGTTAGDILGLGLPLLVVSHKILKIWEQFEKFETFKVEIENMSLSYTGVIFLGRGGPFDPERSKAIYSKSLNEEGKPAIMNMNGLYFDERKCDGSDLLTVDDFPCIPIITQRVVKAMKIANITNCVYTPLEKYKMY